MVFLFASLGFSLLSSLRSSLERYYSTERIASNRQMAFEWSKQTYEVRFNSLFDNLAGRNFQDRWGYWCFYSLRISGCVFHNQLMLFTLGWMGPTLSCFETLLLWSWGLRYSTFLPATHAFQIERNMTEYAKRTQENLKRLELELNSNFPFADASSHIILQISTPPVSIPLSYPPRPHTTQNIGMFGHSLIDMPW